MREDFGIAPRALHRQTGGPNARFGVSVFFWIPGLILALFGYPLIVSWWSMLIIPINLVVYNALRRWQEHHVFSVHQIDLPADRRGFWGYLFLYQAHHTLDHGCTRKAAPSRSTGGGQRCGGPALELAGLDHRRPYDMRHTFAFFSLRAGVPISDLAREMGHTDVSRTYRSYGQWCSEQGERAAMMRSAWAESNAARDQDVTK